MARPRKHRLKLGDEVEITGLDPSTHAPKLARLNGERALVLHVALDNWVQIQLVQKLGKYEPRTWWVRDKYLRRVT